MLNKLGEYDVFIQRLTLHQNGVNFGQQFNGAIRTRVTALHDNLQCRQ